LAFCLNKQKRYADAYQVLRESKELYDNTFSTKSYQNAGLLGIRNMYQEELEERDKIILERDKELIQQKAKVLTIQMVFLTFFSIIIVALLFRYMKLQRRKFKTEKEQQQLKAAVAQEQNRALVDLKNKEITSFTLRLIDKESIISEMIQSINEHAPANIGLLKSVKHKTTGSIKLWEEFDKRFVDVNKGFYEKLKANFPDLTPTELKHCALIKLKFSAKEMAQLLNISINGVNTSRYRIRKKLKLEREANLTTVIGGL
jgi:DNA-binding CsgD family transcriptional regulator